MIKILEWEKTKWYFEAEYLERMVYESIPKEGRTQSKNESID